MPPKEAAGRRGAAPSDSAPTLPAVGRAPSEVTALAGAAGAGLDSVALDSELLASVWALIAATRRHVAQSVNSRRPDKNEPVEGEAAPVGLILCAGKSVERVELLELEGRRVRVARYLLELPPKDELRRQLHRALERARQRVAAAAPGDDLARDQ